MRGYTDVCSPRWRVGMTVPPGSRSNAGLVVWQGKFTQEPELSKSYPLRHPADANYLVKEDCRELA